MNLGELYQARKAALDKAEALVSAVEKERRQMSGQENEKHESSMREIRNIDAQIAARSGPGSIRQFDPIALLDAGRPNPGAVRRGQTQMSSEYTESFLAFVRSGGKQATSALSEGFDAQWGGFALPTLPRMNSALYEGAPGSGGYAVPTLTDPQIVPLAVPDLGVRSLARVIPTTNDLKLPIQNSFGTAAIKAESGSSTNTFTESDPTLSQTTLTAYMVGLTHTCSWELLQDVGIFQEFGVRDLLNAIDIFEDNKFVNGNGTSEPQALVGNVGTGSGTAYTVDSTGAYLLQATTDVTGTLKAQYFRNASWLMARSTATAIRRAQTQANLYSAIWTRENGRDFLHGFPVVYSQAMPTIPTATTAGVTPILFGDFNTAYTIGDRGGSAGGGVYVKILDQPLATSGQTILLGYRRVDGRVVRSEAVQGVSISHT